MASESSGTDYSSDSESIGYYYIGGYNDSSSSRSSSDSSTPNARTGSVDNSEQSHERDSARLKKDLTVLSLGQLRNILLSLIDGADAHELKPITKLIGEEVVRLRNERSFHWNDSFQTALEAKSNKDLSHLGEDFHFTANLYSQVLIAEKDLPDWKKTILPVNIGGFAGGTKYICHGIVFKFASDDQKIYGNQQFAAKAVAAELRHCSAIRESSGAHLAVPLGVSIDWLGHRLSATSLLPLRK